RLLPCRLEVGDIASDRQRAPVAAELDRHRRYQRRKNNPAAAAEGGFEVAHLATLEQGFDEEVEPLAALPDIQLIEALANQIRFCDSERSHHLLVHVDDGAVGQ